MKGIRPPGHFSGSHAIPTRPRVRPPRRRSSGARAWLDRRIRSRSQPSSANHRWRPPRVACRSRCRLPRRRLVAVGPADIADALHGPPFSERSAPRVTNTTVRFLSPDVALIDARQIRYGSQFLRQSLPVLLVLRRNGGVWRLHSWRVTPFCRTLSIRYLWRFTSHPAALNGFLRGHEALHCGGTALPSGCEGPYGGSPTWRVGAKTLRPVS